MAPLNRKLNTAGEFTLGNLVADAQRATMQSKIALMNSGGICNDLDAGEILHWERYMVFNHAEIN
ncbi:5'-nucleotidase C-terminal domain-containing protein (plasmid) [Bacillus tropicus]|nr:5'-nucleotidase C-terminal domain-containing protein [Bacillus tropicus]